MTKDEKIPSFDVKINLSDSSDLKLSLISSIKRMAEHLNKLQLGPKADDDIVNILCLADHLYQVESKCLENDKNIKLK